MAFSEAYRMLDQRIGIFTALLLRSLDQAALQAGEIAGAGLDVFEIEPLPKEHPLWRMDNVIITPHCAAASPRVPERHLHTLLENLRRFVAGQPLLNVVDKRMWC